MLIFVDAREFYQQLFRHCPLFPKHMKHYGKISPRSPYEQRVQCYKMNSLRERRLMHDLMFFHKLVNNKLDCLKLVERVGLKVPHNIPRYPVTNLFNTQASNTNIGANSPLVRMSREMNSCMKSSPNIDIFQISINMYM